MRKIKLQVQISIDGFIADAKGSTDWAIWNWGPDWTWDPELQHYFTTLKSTIDCVLLSRKMAEEGFINHWGNISKKQNDHQATFAKHIANARKVIFTKTLSKAEWPNSELAKGNLMNEVTKLKNQEGKDIIVYGGASFVASLIKANLIDEYYLFVNPVVLGKGLPIFTDIQQRLKLKPLEATLYPCGITVLKFSGR